MKKIDFASNGNCIKLPVDLCCKNFRCGFKVLEKQTCKLKQKNVGAQPVHRHKMFCYGFIKIHDKFGSDPQNSFEEMQKKRDTAMPSLTSFLTCSVMGRVG